jgi:tetratricopeptide (TPR) repeat protein
MKDMGEVNYNMGEKEEAGRWYERTIKFVENLKRSGRTALQLEMFMDLEMSYGRLALCLYEKKGESVKEQVDKLLKLQQGTLFQIVENSSYSAKKKIIATITVVNTLLELAHSSISKGNTTRGLQCFKNASQICQNFSRLDSASPSSSNIPTLADTQENIELGRTSFLTRLGRLEEAETAILQLLEKQLSRLPPTSDRLIATYNNLGHVLAMKRAYPESERALLKAIELTLLPNSEIEAPQRAERLYTMQTLLSNVLREQGKLEEAVEVMETNVKLSKAAFGEISFQSIHSDFILASTLSLLGQTHQAHQHYASAYYHFRSAATMADKAKTISPSIFMPLASQYASSLIEAHQNDSAEQVLLETKNYITKVAGKGSILLSHFIISSSPLYALINQQATAERDLLQSIQSLSNQKASPSRDILLSQSSLALGLLYLSQRQFPTSKNQLDTALAIARKIMANEDEKKEIEKTSVSTTNQVNSQESTGKVSLKSNNQSDGLELTLQALSSLSNWYISNGQAQKAISSMEDAVETAKKRLGEGHPQSIALGLDLAKILVSSSIPSIASQGDLLLSNLSSTISSSNYLSKSQKKASIDKIRSIQAHQEKKTSQRASKSS